jgi:6-phosphogluconolactonase/glucosamine-6-phosphate isomerase/deaminase
MRAAREVLFLVTGADKAETLVQVFNAELDDEQALPAARVSASDGRSSWLVDPEAARGIHRH